MLCGRRRVDPIFKRRKGLRNNEQKLAPVSSRFLELKLGSGHEVAATLGWLALAD